MTAYVIVLAWAGGIMLALFAALYWVTGPRRKKSPQALAIESAALKDIPASVWEVVCLTRGGRDKCNPSVLQELATHFDAPMNPVMVIHGWLPDPRCHGLWSHISGKRERVMLPDGDLLGLCLAYRRHIAAPDERPRALIYRCYKDWQSGSPKRPSRWHRTLWRL
jgi:hypothetical protein